MKPSLSRYGYIRVSVSHISCSELSETTRWIIDTVSDNFCLKYASRKLQGDQEVLKLNGTHQLLLYSDDVNLLGKTTSTKKKTIPFTNGQNRRRSGCRRRENSVQSSLDRAPLFVHCSLWRYTAGGSKWKYCITGNFCSWTFMGATRGWRYSGVWLHVHV